MMRILLVDDDLQSLESTKRILEHSKYLVSCAHSGQEALSLLSAKSGFLPQLVITDVRMPGMTGMEFVEAYQKRGFKIPFIVMTAFGQVQDAVWAMKMGAADFLLKPFKIKSLCDAVEQISKRMQKAELNLSRNTMIGSSRSIHKMKVMIEQVAKTEASVLILGESGCGKEQVARLIHELSHHRSGPFVAVNCAAIPENLMESELFGFEKGAFSGADQAKPGLIESANGGTLLLDEIGDMPLLLQPKLLRVLEEQTVRRIGSNQEKSVHIRVMAATHQDLKKKVQAGLFRQDLFYRLDVMTIDVPSLREHSEDIPELTQYFLAKFALEHGRHISGIDSEAQAVLMRHLWPGNVRELSNVLERAVVLNEGGLIQKKDLPLHFDMDSETPSSKELVKESESITIPLGMTLKDIENLMIQKALKASQGDRALAAKLLGVNERTIYRKINKAKEE